MRFSELRRAAGMSLVEISNYFNIPYRTIQNWDSGKREPPNYVIELMAYKLKQEKIIREEA